MTQIYNLRCFKKNQVNILFNENGLFLSQKNVSAAFLLLLLVVKVKVGNFEQEL